MSDTTGIEWTDATWTPIRARRIQIQDDGGGKERVGWHCEHVSEGCRNCYAERLNDRLGTGLDFKPGTLFRQERVGYNNGEAKVFLDEKMLLAPLRWKKPRMIFVCSMTDLFGSWVPDEMIDRIFAVMALCPQHTFQVLTKRSERMRDYLTHAGPTLQQLAQVPQVGRDVMTANTDWPLPNVWLGVSAEDQATADERIPLLLQTPAAVRFVSAEPLLRPIDLRRLIVDHPAYSGVKATLDALIGQIFDRGDTPIADPAKQTARLNWIIVGGESGPWARPMHPQWVRSIRDQCAAAGVPFFFKQWGEWLSDGQHGSAEFRSFTRFGSDWMILDRDGEIDIPDERWPCEEVGEIAVCKVGKKCAGRLLDGVEHNAFPAVRA